MLLHVLFAFLVGGCAEGAQTATVQWKTGMTAAEQAITIDLNTTKLGMDQGEGHNHNCSSSCKGDNCFSNCLGYATVTFQWSGTHDIHKMSDKAAFDSCNFESRFTTKEEVHTPGTWSRSSAGGTDGETTYFACGVSGHCAAGQKVAVTVRCIGDDDAVLKAATAAHGTHAKYDTCAKVVSGVDGELSKCWNWDIVGASDDTFTPAQEYGMCYCACKAAQNDILSAAGYATSGYDGRVVKNGIQTAGGLDRFAALPGSAALTPTTDPAALTPTTDPKTASENKVITAAAGTMAGPIALLLAMAALRSEL